MEENDGVGGGGGLVGDPNEQFHHGNEAISAVVDEGFLGEEEEDDFEDLYNDVNVGENFLQSMKKSEEFGATNEEVVPTEKKSPLQMSFNKQTLPPQPFQGVPETSFGGGGSDGGERKLEREEEGSSARLQSGRVGEGYQQQDVGFGGQGVDGGAPGGGGGIRVELGQQPVNKRADVIDEHMGNRSVPHQGGVFQQHPPPSGPSGVTSSVPVGNVGSYGNEGSMKQGGSNGNGAGMNVNNGYGNSGGGGGGVIHVNESGAGRGAGGVGGHGTLLFVGDLHWWTTDADLEAELCKYGPVKEVRFFDEKASGKSKGYCQVEFYDPRL